MPQLLSRMDDMGWLTPSIAEILDQGTPPPGGDGSIRDQQKLLQNRFAAFDAPIRIINIRPYSSYTVFIARPESVGRLGNRRSITANEIRRGLGQLAEEYPDWQFGFLPNVQEDDDTVGIIIRTEAHNPLSLRRLLVRTSFRDRPSPLSVVMGNTLEHRLLVHDLVDIGNLLVIGSQNAKLHFMRSLLLTITSMNTPSELRLVVAGGQSEFHKQFTYIPHAVGRALLNPKDGQRLLEGLSGELARRGNVFKEYGFRDIDEYNARLKEEHETIMPRILVVIDSLSDKAWQEVRSQWIPLVTNLLGDGGKHGIHVILTADELHVPDVPSEFNDLLPLKIIMRAAATNQVDKLKNFHSSLLHFIDAFIVDDRTDDDNQVIPVELCAVTEDEIQNAIGYWRQAASARTRETENPQVSGRTGVTGVLNRNSTTEAVTVEAQKEITRETPTQSEPPRVESTSRMPSLEQVQALAAYLGWIGVGPLQDILGMSGSDAKKAMIVLRRMGVIQNDETNTPRFVRLSDNPLSQKE